MQVSADGLVFVKFNFDGGSFEYVNIAAISRVRQMSEEWCKARSRNHPTVRISIDGMGEDLVMNLGADEVKERITKAIDDHYKAILEKELLT